MDQMRLAAATIALAACSTGGASGDAKPARDASAPGDRRDLGRQPDGGPMDQGTTDGDASRPRPDVPDFGPVAPGPVISDDLIDRWLRGLNLLSYCFEFVSRDLSAEWSDVFLEGVPTLKHAGLSEFAVNVPFFSCLTTVERCEDFEHCDGYRRADECQGLPRELPQCNGDRLELCRWGAPLLQTVDCSAHGMVCGRSDSGVDQCGLAGCQGPTSDCRGRDHQWCSGDITLVGSCWNRMGCRYAVGPLPDAHFYREGPCIATVTQTCTPGDDFGTARCSGAGPSCDPETFKAECDGDVLRNCVGGRLSESRCGDLIEGMTCIEHPELGATCRYPDYACDSVFATATCAGDVVTACVFGRYHSVDCAQFPNGTCRVVDRDGGVFHDAVCVDASR